MRKFLGPGWGQGHGAPEWPNLWQSPRLWRETLSKKVPFHLYNNKQSADVFTSCEWWCADLNAVQSKHFNIHPSLQSLHLMVPSFFPHFEQLVCPRKSPSPSCCNASSKNVSLNLSHSVSRSWIFKVRMYYREAFEVLTYCVCCIPFPLSFSSGLRQWGASNFLWWCHTCFTVTTCSHWIWTRLHGGNRSWLGQFKGRR